MISKTILSGKSLLAAISDKKDDGRRDKIPTVINNEIPFPIPLSVMRSPNHTANIEPATIQDTAVVHHNMDSSAGSAPWILDAYNEI